MGSRSAPMVTPSRLALPNFLQSVTADICNSLTPAPIHRRSLSRELPGSVIDTRRFRPNILVDWPDEDEAMPEKDWIDREIRIGEVVLRGKRPCGRCGFITIEQDRLPVDVEILRRVVQHHDRDFGIYCDVVFPGHVTTDAMVTVA